MSLRISRWSRHPVVIAILYFTVVTLVITQPLILGMAESVVGQVGDNFYYIWEFGWALKVVRREGSSFLHTNQLNYPEGWHLASTDWSPMMVVIGLPAALAFGPTFGYNFSILASFVLSGLMMFLWAQRLTGRGLPSLAAGTIFAFSPYRVSHFLAGHLNILGTQWLPLLFMGVVGLLASTNRRKLDLFTTSLGLGLVSLTSQYYFYMSVMIAAGVLLVALVRMGRGWTKRREIVIRFGIAGLSSLPLVLLGIWPFVARSQEGGLPVRPLESVRNYSASPTDYVLPATFHPIWGRWIGYHFDRSYWVEATLYLGIVGSTLGLVAVASRPNSREDRDLIILLVSGAALAFVLSLGVNLFWLSKPVTIDLPERFELIPNSEPTLIPMPGMVLFRSLPYYSSMRVWMRYGVFVSMFVAVLAGKGLAALSSRMKPKVGTALNVLILAGILLDIWPRPFTMTEVKPRPVDLWMREQPGGGAFIEFPLSRLSDQDQFYFTLLSGRPTVAAQFSAYVSPQYERIAPALDGFPDESSVDVLKELGVQYVLLEIDSYEDLSRIVEDAQKLGVRDIGRIGEEYVLEIQPTK